MLYVLHSRDVFQTGSSIDLVIWLVELYRNILQLDRGKFQLDNDQWFELWHKQPTIIMNVVGSHYAEPGDTIGDSYCTNEIAYKADILSLDCLSLRKNSFIMHMMLQYCLMAKTSRWFLKPCATFMPMWSFILWRLYSLTKEWQPYVLVKREGIGTGERRCWGRYVCNWVIEMSSRVSTCQGAERILREFLG